MAPKERSTIRRRHFAGVGMSLWRQICGFIYAQDTVQFLCLLPVTLYQDLSDVEFLSVYLNTINE